MLKKWLVFVFAVCISVLFASGDAFGWRRGHKPKPEAEAIKEKIEDKIEKQKYINSHDLNNDGKVNIKDRLLWIRAKSAAVPVVYISDEDKGLVAVIDEDNDGDIELWERKRFYEKYDLNRDGAIDDVEIDKAEE